MNLMDTLLVQVGELLSGNTPRVRKAASLLFENARSVEHDLYFFDEGKELEFYFNLSVAILKYPERVEKMMQFLETTQDFNGCLIEMNGYLKSGEIPEGFL